MSWGCKMGKNAGLIKFGAYEHIKAFYEKGEMYFNTFKWFKDLEAIGDGRADKNEYCSLHYAADNLGEHKFRFELYPEGRPEEAIELNKENGLISLTIDFGDDKEYTHLYSFSCLKLNDVMQNDLIISTRNFAPTKDYAVVIYDINAFLDKFTKAMKEKYKLGFKATTIEYVDKNTYSGEMGAFRKFNDFAYQNEYRIAINFNSLEPQKIYIGSLKDIASKPMNKKEFYQMPLKIQHKNDVGDVIGTTIISNKSALDEIEKEEAIKC